MQEVVEGLLYVQGDLGLTIKQIEDILEIDEEEAKKIVLNLKSYYDENKRGLRINFLGNTIKLTTREEHREYYQKLLEEPTSNNLSQSALETLAIIAYNEPITRGSVDELRGVDSSYVMRRLLAKGLIKECGKSDLPGRPILYKTTDDFLDYFGLASKEELPNIELLEEENTPKDLYTSIYKEGDNNGREGNN
ncbi:MAG: SMC-Scp complex subunit ScpB [Bacilli bacterium]|nr:SMC-Scp complex subunit ScpB [Bacilli bacterium]